ncbi:M4 family metallopeptidase [Methyloceanibacter sp.]|uniref:M4 family metallopeptidase n=1 Tax=Methyloceanibacter sp. TaxID=1965321 RepID=UPI003D6D86F1
MRKKLVAYCLVGVSVGLLLTATAFRHSQSFASSANAPAPKISQVIHDGNTTFLRGELAYVGALPLHDRESTERKMATILEPALAPFHLKPNELKLRKLNTDETGSHHLRYRQVIDGLEVIGGDFVVHVNAQGMIYAINGTAHGKLPTGLGMRDIGVSAARKYVEKNPLFLDMSFSTPRPVFFADFEGETFKAYEFVAEGKRGPDPVRDKVYVDVHSGTIVGVHPQIQFLKNRSVHSSNNGTNLPGSLIRSEGQAATGDVDVNAAYDGASDTYEAYKNFWNRDSFDNAGAKIISSVHYGNKFCNSGWNGTQLFFGDGDAAYGCLPLARGIDVVAHEFTHALTESESGLIYSGESGGVNEAMSDIFGAFTEAWVEGNRTGSLVVSGDVWKVGEDVLPPALRYMNDPVADGVSLDFWTSTAGTVDVRYSSGIANLAFYLMSQGGTHPRGKSSIVVTGIGMAKAIRVFYKANVDILTSNSKFSAARFACEQAASELGFTAAEQAAVGDAWQAVGVAAAPPPPLPPPPPPPPPIITLTNGVPVNGISDVAAGERFYKLDVPAAQTSVRFTLSGGTGDADLYTRLGSLPTTSSYTCRPYRTGNNETCTISAPSAGSYYVMLRGYAAYANTKLTGLYQTGISVPFTEMNLSGSTGTSRVWNVTPGPGKHLTVAISGGMGDADLYTRFGAPPTTVGYDCRPYLYSNNESCTVLSTVAGSYHIMLRAYTSFSGVTLKVTF